MGGVSRTGPLSVSVNYPQIIPSPLDTVWAGVDGGCFADHSWLACYLKVQPRTPLWYSVARLAPLNMDKNSDWPGSVAEGELYVC